MRSSHQVLLVTLSISVVGSIIWSADHYYRQYQNEKMRAEVAEQRANAFEIATVNVLHTFKLMNAVMEMNQYAKQQISDVSQSAASEIKAAAASDDCTVRVVPSGAVKRLYDYANGLRADTRGDSDHYRIRPFVASVAEHHVGAS